MAQKIAKPYGTHYYVMFDGKVVSQWATLARAKKVALIRDRPGHSVVIAKAVAVVEHGDKFENMPIATIG